MQDELRVRLVILIGLAAVGVTLAGIGAAFGVTLSLVNQSDTPGFVVTEEKITVSGDDDTVTLVENMSSVRAVRINSVESNQFRVQTVGDQLTAEERKQARRIARENTTVQRHLNASHNYTFSVTPTYSADTTETTSIDLDNSSDQSEYMVVNTSANTSDRSVVIEQEPNTVEKRAVMHVHRRNERSQHSTTYTIDVDLLNRTVTGFEEVSTLSTKSAPAARLTQLGDTPFLNSQLEKPYQLSTEGTIR